MIRQVIHNKEELDAFLLDFNLLCFAFDTEGTGLVQDTLELEGVSLCDGKKACYIVYDEWAKLTLQKIFLDSPTHLYIAHNIVFDMRVLHKYDIRFPNTNIFDTQVAIHLLDEESKTGLKFLAQRDLGVTNTISWEEASKLPKEQFYEYAINDAVWTYQLYELYSQRLQAESLERLFNKIEMPFQFVLLEMAVTGVLADTGRIKSIQAQLTKDVEESKIKLLNLLGSKYSFQIDLMGNSTIVSDINFNSPKQVGDIFFKKLGLKPVEQTESGMDSVGAKTLLVYKDNPVVTAYAEFKNKSKLLDAFIIPIQNYIQNDGRIRPHFNDVGTKTGRLSSSEPNFQQLPAEDKDGYGIRSCLIAPPGYKLIACDYSGQEVRVMAQQSKDPILIDSLIKGQDMHLKVANQFYQLGIPEECLFESHPEYNTYKKKYKNERSNAKTITFGLAYGKGAYGFSQDFNVSEEEAQAMMDKYFLGMPQMFQAIKASHDFVKKNGYIRTMAGRIRHFQKIKKDDWEGYPKSALRQSFNFLIQGFAADMMRKAMVVVHKDKKPEWDLKGIMTIHDEACYQVREQYAEEAKKYIVDKFEHAVNFVVPIVADAKIGNNYQEVK
jgi:DNA polymerase I